MTIVVTDSLVIPDAELTERFMTSGGPGGQHANKAATRVELTWDIEAASTITEHQRSVLLEQYGPVVRVVVDEERSQLRNRQIARERLAARVRYGLIPTKARKATKPSSSARRRRLEQKRQNSQTKRLRQRPSMDD